MNQRLIATTPSLLLASAVAVVAQKVGGYKDGFPIAAAQQALDQVLTLNLDDDEFHDGLAQLRTIYDRAEGAGSVLAGLPVAPIEIDLTAGVYPSVFIDGVDTRDELKGLLRLAETILKEARDAIVEAEAEINKLTIEANRANLGLASNAELLQELAARTNLGHIDPDYRTLDQDEAKAFAQINTEAGYRDLYAMAGEGQAGLDGDTTTATILAELRANLEAEFGAGGVTITPIQIRPEDNVVDFLRAVVGAR